MDSKNESENNIEGATKISNAADLKKKIKESKQSFICICFFNDSEPCRKIMSRLHELTNQFKEVEFFLVLVEECAELMQTFSLTMLPTFILIQDMVILEIFVGCSYYRIVRRIELCLLDDEKEGKRYKELLRVSKIANDSVYVLKSLPHDSQGRSSVKSVNVLGLRYGTTGPTWKDRTKMFVEACEKVRKSNDFMSFLYEAPETSESEFESQMEMQRQNRRLEESMANLRARRVSFGENFDLSPLKRAHRKFSSKKKRIHPVSTDEFQPMLQESSRPLPTLDDLSPPPTGDMDMGMYSELRNTIITEELQDLQQKAEDDEKCTVAPELLALEDRDYTKDEVVDLINKCLKVCWVAKNNRELDLKAPMPPTMDFAENLGEILSSSSGDESSSSSDDNFKF